MAASARDQPALSMVEAVLDEPTERRTTSAPRDARRVLDEARAAWPEALVVIVDTERALLTAIRTEDATIVERRLDPAAVRAPYAVAQATVELIVLARDAPLAEEAAVEPPPALGRQPSPRRSSVTPALGWELVASFADPAVFSGPSLGVTVRIERLRIYGGLGLRAHPMLEATRRRGAASASYRRRDLVLEGAFGARSAQGWAGITAQLALAVVRASARERDERDVHRRVTPWLGLGGEVGFRFWRGAVLRLSASVGLLPSARDVIVRGALAFEEGRLQLRSGLTFGWSLR